MSTLADASRARTPLYRPSAGTHRLTAWLGLYQCGRLMRFMQPDSPHDLVAGGRTCSVKLLRRSSGWGVSAGAYGFH